jgi:hypothetical protein
MDESRKEWEDKHPPYEMRKDPVIEDILNRIATYGSNPSRSYDDKAARDAMTRVQLLVGDINIRIITTDFDAALALIVTARDKLAEADAELRKLAQAKHGREGR